MSEFHIFLKRKPNSEPKVHVDKGNLHEEYVKTTDGYQEYLDKYGYHFNDKLAEWAISRLENVSGPHSWSLKQIDSVVTSIAPKKDFKHKVTIGDLAYQANMYYADLYPDGISVDHNCVKSAILIANDPDGYEGQIFCRWLTDYMMKSVEIPWETFL
jgi:hypothetical protein